MQRGIFIVLEGGEGAGKTTQIKRLQQQLPQEFPNREFVFTREPGGSPFADQIRSLILGDSGKDANGFTLLGLFVAARADHVSKVVLPALAENKVVICDRYLAATYAYQVVAQENREIEELFWAHTKLVPQPDLTLLCDIDPRIAQERVNARAGEKTHFDSRSLEFHEHIREGFDEYFKKSPHAEVVRIRAEESEEEVWNQVQSAVKSKL